MKKILYAWLLLVFFLTVEGFAQNAKIINITRTFNSGVAGTPRVVYDEARDFWVVVWRQGSNIQARVVQGNGKMGALKKLATGVGSAEQSFDLALDTHIEDAAHLLAFEDSAGLQVRAVPSLNPGAKHLIESNAKGSMPRLVFDPAGSYFIFWLGSQDGTRSALRVRQLSEEGEPLSGTVTLASAPSGQTFDSLNVARKPDGSMTAILLQQSSTTGSVLKVNISSNGTLLGLPSAFQGSTPGLKTVGDIDFSNDSIGFGIWMDKRSLKRRKVTASGEFSGSSRSLRNAVSGDAAAIQTGISFNPAVKQFVAVWTNENQTLLVNLNGTTGAPVKAHSPIATSILNFSRNPNASSNSEGKTLVVWEDSTAEAGATGTAKFRIRGGIVTTEVPGSYQLSFHDHSGQPVSTLPVNQELVLHASVQDSNGAPAQRGTVTFQSCSRGPKAECRSGGPGTWVPLITMEVNPGTCPGLGLGIGHACVNVGFRSSPTTIGFRFEYDSQGSGIGSGVSPATDFTWF